MNRNDLAFPVTETCATDISQSLGLTKREYAAVKALQGLLSNATTYQGYSSDSDMAAKAIGMADALFTELEK